MINSHSLEKLDINFQHKTIPAVINEFNDAGAENQPKSIDNPHYLGQSIMELFLENQPYNIQSMITQRDKTMGSVHFDGDSIEFVTKYFENRTVIDSCKELKATKKLFLDKINESAVLNEKLAFPDYNVGLNMFMTNQENLVLFNNGTYHFHITLPTLTEDSRIVDYPAFEKTHSNAIYLLQWFEPFFIATLGSPDIMAVINNTNGMEQNFTLGSMRNAMSRYIGVGTYNKSMAKGKILTYKVADFRKLLQFEKEEELISYQLENDLISDKTISIPMQENSLPLAYPLFKKDALIFKKLESKSIAILENKVPFLKINFEGFPSLGIWTKENAAYICLEPWFGFADTQTNSGKLSEKEGIQIISAHETFVSEYSIEIL